MIRPPIFAEDMPATWVQIVGAIVMFLVGGGAWKIIEKLLDKWSRSRESRQKAAEKAEDRQRNQRRDDEDVYRARMHELMERQDQEIERLRQEVKDASTKASRAEVRAARAVVWIRHLEGRLDEAKIPYRPWTETPNGEYANGGKQ